MVRRRFPDTAYWNPKVRTDEKGQATVSVELPDNLTTWRMGARGVTADTLVGEAEVDVVSTKNLLVRQALLHGVWCVDKPPGTMLMSERG